MLNLILIKVNKELDIKLQTLKQIKTLVKFAFFVVFQIQAA